MPKYADNWLPTAEEKQKALRVLVCDLLQYHLSSSYDDLERCHNSQLNSTESTSWEFISAFWSMAMEPFE